MPYKLFRLNHVFLVVFVISILSTSVFANNIILDKRDIDKGKREYKGIIPYAFYTNDLEFAAGIAGATTGYFQDQLSLFGALMATTNKSYGFYFLEKGFQIPFTERLFLDTEGYLAYYTKYREYIKGNAEFSGEQAGTNDSNKDNFLRGEGNDNKAEFSFLYVLPIGVGADKPINTYVLDRGLLVQGETCRGKWNPFESGRTFLKIQPFAHWQNFDKSEEPLKNFNSNGLALGIKYDNTDFYENPSKGSMQNFLVRRDFNAFNDTSEWTTLEFELEKYFSLGENSLFKQQVIALDFWTAYSPTMKYVQENGMLAAKDAPPDYYGATLGGLYRMRGFQDRRFHDKAGLYYSIEYRVMPQWQPLRDIALLRPFQIDWWQFAVFAEAGRVAPEWNFSTLNSDLKFDAGVSARVMAFKNIGRLDFSFSDEEFTIIAFLGHPF